MSPCRLQVSLAEADHRVGVANANTLAAMSLSDAATLFGNFVLPSMKSLDFCRDVCLASRLEI